MLKSFIEVHKQRNNIVLIAFLEPSNAFDRIDHSVLFKKFLLENVPLFIIKILMDWYCDQ